MKFVEALVVLEQGGMVRRCDWPEDTFLFRQVPAIIPSSVVPKMQSLPDAVKVEFMRRFEDQENFQIDAIYYDHQLAKVDRSNLITSWSPQVEDLGTEFWEEYS